MQREMRNKISEPRRYVKSKIRPLKSNLDLLQVRKKGKVSYEPCCIFGYFITLNIRQIH